MMNRSNWVLGIGSIALLALSVAGCSSAEQGNEREASGSGALAVEQQQLSQTGTATAGVEEPEAPFGEVNTIEMVKGQIVSANTEKGRVVTRAGRPGVGDSKKVATLSIERTSRVTSGATSKVSPSLLNSPSAVNAKEATDTVEVIVRYKNTLRVPRFPQLRGGEPRDSQFNVQATARAHELARRFQAERQPKQERHASVLRDQHQGEVTGRFWLVDATMVKVQRARLEQVASDPDVEYIEPRVGGSVAWDISDGRAIISSDPYYDIGLTNGYIAVIDSGVRDSHVLFNNPYRLGWVRDCVNGIANGCTTPAPGGTLNPTDETNHGTGVASIIGANANLGQQSRGVTGITIDTYRVTAASGGIYGDALIRAFETAVVEGAQAINVSLARWEDQNSSIAAAADAAFDGGAMVFAAVGNEYEVGNVRCPSNARKAIGVGAVEIPTLTRSGYSNVGPSLDGRTKPDIMGPTGVTAAWNGSDTDSGYFNGTSGATPHVTGAGALMRNWLSNFTATEPGHVYAMMIASGNNRNSPAYDYQYGGGVVVMPTNAALHWGKLSVTNGATSYIDLPAAANLDATIWWPETSAAHNDVDLSLLDANGNYLAGSSSGSSVWEKASVQNSANLASRLKIYGYGVTGTQTVYWAAIRR